MGYLRPEVWFEHTKTARRDTNEAFRYNGGAQIFTLNAQFVHLNRHLKKKHHRSTEPQGASTTLIGSNVSEKQKEAGKVKKVTKIDQGKMTPGVNLAPQIASPGGTIQYAA